jgi:uncharacterized ferritin-like protein (DUF455 family)
LVEDLTYLAATERAAAHVVAGWLPKIPELDDKIRLASVLEGSMSRAVALRAHALKLLERDESQLLARPSWIAPLRALDASGNAGQVVEVIESQLAAFLLVRYRTLFAQLDELYDARAIAMFGAAIESLSAAQASGTELRAGPGTLYAALGDARRDGRAALVPLDELLWQPQDRVAVPARPEGRPRPEPGALGLLRTGSRRETEDIVAELNDNVMAELSAMELLSRCSYEHPDLPWSSHMALAMHVSDEARHAAIFRRLLAQHAGDESRLPQHAANYEYAYQFPECEIGSKHELVWRILIMCTVLEALAIDKLPAEIAVRDWLGQPEFARALDYIATDELMHSENGLRLTRQLCEQHRLDPMLERERAHGRFFGRQRNVRARYLAADPERASREIALLEGPDPDAAPFTSRVQVELRRRASFTDDECEQVDRWGYHPIPMSS